MKKDIKEKWLAALEKKQLPDGTKIRKARGRLCNPTNNSYCCLGVLREIVGGTEPDGHAILDRSNTLAKAGLKKIELASQGFSQGQLAAANDQTRGWDLAIEIIKEKL